MAHVALVTTLLGRTDLFRGLGTQDRAAVAAQMREATYRAGQLIFSRGDPADDLHLVVEGRVRLSVLSAEGRVLSFSHAERADIFGEIGALDGRGRTADATALTRVSTMTLTRPSLKRLMEGNPQLAQAAVAFVCRRLRATSDQVEAIALHSTQVRLARFLLAAMALKGQTQAGTLPVALDLGISQTELGLLLGASRSKVNQAMAELGKLAAVRRRAGRLECDIVALKKVSEGE